MVVFSWWCLTAAAFAQSCAHTHTHIQCTYTHTVTYLESFILYLPPLSSGMPSFSHVTCGSGWPDIRQSSWRRSPTFSWTWGFTRARGGLAGKIISEKKIGYECNLIWIINWGQVRKFIKRNNEHWWKKKYIWGGWDFTILFLLFLFLFLLISETCLVPGSWE